jgi:hypothetical protein
MQKQKSNSGVNKTAQQDRQHPRAGKRRSQQNGTEQKGTDSAFRSGFGLHLLEKELHTLPLLEIALAKGDTLEEKFPGLVKMIDTEARQLQAIEDLYKIVKAQPKYKQLKEQKWTDKTQPLQVLLWLLRKLGPLAEGANWTVDIYKQSGKTRYRFVIFKYYHGGKLLLREEYLPLDFLPMLLKRDRPLHDLIIDVLALVSREVKLPVWDEDGDFSTHLSDLLNVPPGGYSVYALERQHKVYSSGPAGQYLRYFKRRRRVVTFKTVIDQLSKYDPKSDRKQAAVWWIKKGIQLARYGRCIKANSFVPNYMPGEVISAYQQYKIIWSAHKNDNLYARTLSKMRKVMKQGDFYPLMFSIAKPGQVLQPLKYDPFPEKLFGFLDEGIKHFCYRHDTYYYKDAFGKQETPAEQFLGDEQTPGLKLLQAIELSDLQKKYK